MLKIACLECPPLAGVARSAGGGSVDADELFIIQAAKVGYPSFFLKERIEFPGPSP